MKYCRPILDPIASIFHKLFCGRSARPEGTGQTLDGSQFPGSGSIEANRRRCEFLFFLIVLAIHHWNHLLSRAHALGFLPVEHHHEMIATHWSVLMFLSRASHLIWLLSVPCRERGQRALEQRLAEKLAEVRNAEGTPPPKQQQKQQEDAEDDASDKVWTLVSGELERRSSVKFSFYFCACRMEDLIYYLYKNQVNLFNVMPSIWAKVDLSNYFNCNYINAVLPTVFFGQGMVCKIPWKWFGQHTNCRHRS